MKRIYLLLLLCFSLSSVFAQYTLQDDDVVVENGVIISCSYDYSDPNIIIPDVLDGQSVIGIEDEYNSDEDGVFGTGQINSVVFPSTLQYVGMGEFCYSGITSADFSNCTALNTIKREAFSSSNLTSLDLSACVMLEEIEYKAFYEAESLQSVDFSNCSNLHTIGNNAFERCIILNLDLSPLSSLRYLNERAFYDNSLTTVNFSNLSELRVIGENAFYLNNIDAVDLSDLTALVTLGAGAFGGNNLTEITLPENVNYDGGWLSQNGDVIAEGGTANDMVQWYIINESYTLTDDDVEVENGVIISCSYDFELKMLIIPDVLDGQTIVGISNSSYSGVFSNKGLIDVVLPTHIQNIGMYAFYRNNFSTFDFSQYSELRSLGILSFAKNEDLTSVNFSGCASLTQIGERAFEYCHSLATLDLTNCTSLVTLGEKSFNNCTDITSVDFSDCTNLRNIFDMAFLYADLDTVVLTSCNNLYYIGEKAFNASYSGANFSAFVLPVSNDYPTANWLCSDATVHAGGDQVSVFDESYTLDAPYVVSDGDVVVEDGFIIDADVAENIRDLFIPDTLCDQRIIGIEKEPFEDLNLQQLSLPDGLRVIKRSAFYDAQLDTLDLSNCTELTYVGYSAFRNCQTSFVLPENVNYPALDWECSGTWTTPDTVTNKYALYYLPGYYTLTDDDVVVTDGMLESCSYNFEFVRVNIPDSLDGQLITGIDDNVFSNKGLIEIDLPTGIRSFGNHCFYLNSISVHNLLECVHVEQFGESCFSINSLGGIDFSVFPNLESLGADAFSAALDAYQVSGCDKLTHIGLECFNYCSGGPTALPTPNIPGYVFNYWESTSGDTYAGGEITDISYLGFDANLTYIGYDLQIAIYAGGSPVQGALVEIDGFGSQTSGVDGTVTFSGIDATTDLVYTITADGYQTYIDSVDIVDDNVNVNVSLLVAPYTINFTVYHQTEVLENASIDIGGQTVVTDVDGNVSVELLAGNYPYTVSKDYYNTFSGTLDVSSDMDIPVYLSATQYYIAFTVNDGTNPIEGANVNIDGADYLTNEYGIIVISELVHDTYTYTITADGYLDYVDDITLVESTDLTISMSTETLTYSVTFNVTDGTDPMEDAIVIFDGTSYSTDASGQVILSGLSNGTYDYTVNSIGYQEVSGDVVISDADEIVDVDLVYVGIVQNDVQVSVYPNPTQNILYLKGANNQHYTLTDISGRIVRYGVVSSSIYLLDLSGISTGTYVLKVDGEVIKIIKK